MISLVNAAAEVSNYSKQFFTESLRELIFALKATISNSISREISIPLLMSRGLMVKEFEKENDVIE